MEMAECIRIGKGLALGMRGFAGLCSVQAVNEESVWSQAEGKGAECLEYAGKRHGSHGSLDLTATGSERCVLGVQLGVHGSMEQVLVGGGRCMWR